MKNVGGCYAYGEGVTKDLNKAREWNKKAVTQGFARHKVLQDTRFFKNLYEQTNLNLKGK